MRAACRVLVAEVEAAPPPLDAVVGRKKGEARGGDHLLRGCVCVCVYSLTHKSLAATTLSRFFAAEG